MSKDNDLYCDECSGEDLSYDYCITPQFMGTGDMLLWDVKETLEKIPLELFHKGCERFISSDDSRKLSENDLKKFLDRVQKDVLKDEELTVSGFYGHFPVYTYNESIVLVNPSDMTDDMGELNFPRIRKKQGYSVRDFFRPEGDVITFYGISLGYGIDQILKSKEKTEDSFFMQFCHAVFSVLMEYVSERITLEIRKELLLDQSAGKCFSWGSTELPHKKELEFVSEIMSFENRLDIILSNEYDIEPQYAKVELFVHHPQINSW